MQIYFAPLEGITGYVFRNAYAKYYGGVDRYFTPFITPHTKKLMNSREKRDILPENNRGIDVVPQVLTNKAEELIDISRRLLEYGYNEINLNLGCPSRTVTAKGKGSGFLENTKELEEFFDRFFKVADTKLSIKTRIGVYETSETERLFHIFERFPFSEVIVHARLQQEFYQGIPHHDIFEQFCASSRHTLCYNGDIFSKEQLDALHMRFINCDKYMLGRGLLFRPDMLDETIDTTCMNAERIKKFLLFHDALVEGYDAYMCGDRNVLFKMKELWSYWGTQFKEQHKLLKQIKKTDTLVEYQSLVKQLLDAAIK